MIFFLAPNEYFLKNFRSPNVSVVVSAVTWSVVEEAGPILGVGGWTDDGTGWNTSESAGKCGFLVMSWLLAGHGNVQSASAAGVEAADASALVVVVLVSRRRQDFRIDQQPRTAVNPPSGRIWIVNSSSAVVVGFHQEWTGSHHHHGRTRNLPVVELLTRTSVGCCCSRAGSLPSSVETRIGNLFDQHRTFDGVIHRWLGRSGRPSVAVGSVRQVARNELARSGGGRHGSVSCPSSVDCESA